MASSVNGKVNKMLRCGWLHQRVRKRFIWQNEIKSCAVIGYPSGQVRAILPARDYPPCPARKISAKAMSKSFIDQACSVKMA